jgi:hypothetical protein
MKRCTCFLLLWCCAAAFAQTTPDLEMGLKPFGSYEGGNIDTVNLSNGNLLLWIPLLSYPQRGQAELTFYIRYNNKGFIWQPLPSNPGMNQFVWRGTGVDIIRGRLTAQRLTPIKGKNQSGDDYTVNVFTGFSSDGTAHQLTGNNGFPLDSIGSINRDGVTANSDLNGNQITTSSSGWTDTLGRQIPGTSTSTGYVPPDAPNYSGEPFPGVPTSNYSGCPVTPVAARVWTVPAPNSQTATYKLCYLTYQYQSAFNNP